ncbi:hypothetical protein DESME_06750 [Desulfitobacterium metallireducens DSM 15288]|uniref:Uncharacterized protein n=1 Tax=Desulfitobacterium metallireducens DSM 15288 TaxID=871968 RepID=W0ECN1_9FIRM|nr:hypothetical protein DESME_06750 [Desulfitobacterium metallireducens DSM 15288]
MYFYVDYTKRFKFWDRQNSKNGKINKVPSFAGAVKSKLSFIVIVNNGYSRVMQENLEQTKNNYSLMWRRNN